MKVALVYFALSSMGGIERLGASTIEALNGKGITPDLIVPTNSTRLGFERYMGKKIRARLRPILPLEIRAFGIYQKYLLALLSQRFSDYDIVFNSTGVYAHAPFFQQRARYFLYVHNPLIVRPDIEKYEKGLWKLYWKPFEYAVGNSIKKMGNVKILCNSNYTSVRVKWYWNKDSETVYPPVSIGDFNLGDTEPREGVVSIGRFSPEKDHLSQLYIAQRLPGLTFRICGSASTPYYKHWYDMLRTKAKELNLENVEFYPDIPFKELVRLVNRSKYFIHTMKHEDFGITTCEAIAGGCIPVVHDSGGQREIVPFGNLRFDGVDSAVRILRSLGEADTEPLRSALTNHIKQFDEAIYQKKVLEIMGVG
jgi:glycosyltransferase involved in cell wall biosynthesis